MTIKKVLYGTTRIQKLRRVTLDKNLLETLGLDIGDLVRVELDTENEAVTITRVIESSPHPDQEDAFAARGNRVKK